MGNSLCKCRSTDVIRDRRVHPETLSEYDKHLKERDSSFARADVDSAEQHFAAALKMVHVRDPTAQQYQREVEPLCKLGDVYSKRGQQTGDGGDFVKAAALYNAAIARSEDQVLNGNIETAIREVDKLFLKYILDISHNISLDNTEKHKKQLKEMRDQIKLEMETIDQQLDPYVHDEDNPCVKEIEAKRAQAVRQLFDKIAQQRKDFISLLVEECIGSMGPPPCKYALIGLGSQATGLVTPYSDLEFAILVEEESEECLVYFHNLTHYLHLKVVNLGETILPALAIKSLNDFYSENPLDDWYYDSVTPRGFAFDGSMPKASKTPLGRQGTKDEPPSELICTPENMVSKLQKDVTLYLKEGYHLATILRNPCLIAGDQDLIDTYMDITVEILQADGGKMAQQLAQETLKENRKIYSTSNKSTITARLIDVKKDLYRFPAVAVDCLALSSGIIPTTVWETIEEMEKKQVISPNNAHHLTVLTSISAELRLRTYMANGGQKENLSALASMETTQQGQESSLQTNEVQTNMLKPVFYLQNKKQLFRYYYTSVPLKKLLSVIDICTLCTILLLVDERYDTKTILNSFSDLYENSAKVCGVMYFELCKYRLAITYLDKALEKAIKSHLDIASLLSNLGAAWCHLGDYRKAISYLEQALQMHRSIYGQGTEHLDIALSLNNLGTAWDKLGDYKKALSYLEQALQMYRSIYGQGTEHPHIAASLDNLGSAWGILGDYKKALSYLEQALQMYRSIYGQGTEHPHIANSLDNLGAVWCHLGDYREAISYFKQALQMCRSIYGQGTEHPNIALSLNNLGGAWGGLGDYKKAISYLEQALQMWRAIYGSTTEHDHITKLLNNLGEAWGNLGDYKKAISYHEQALQMERSVYGQTKAHPDIVASLNNLGVSWRKLGDYRKAISYYEQTLQMCRSIYGQTKAHPEIAILFNNLGGAWHHLGDYRKAVSYYEQALQMCRSIYGQGTAHPHIALSLNNLGAACHCLGDNRKALSYYEQSLQMCWAIYGTEHDDIARLLNNLGTAWGHLGDHRKAVNYLEQALQMYRSIYGQGTEHPHIAISLDNLGSAWHDLGDNRKALSYHEQALQMCWSIYGTEHDDIARLLNRVGLTWDDLGDSKKAVSYHEQALEMCRSIYGQGTEHPRVATSLNNLGLAWGDLGDYRKAINYHEQALQMKRSIHGQGTEHPDIANSLNNLGLAWRHLGDHRKAISYHEQALQMRRSIYGQGTEHPDIATSLNNLGEAWRHLGDNRKAISYHEQALQMTRSIYGQTKAHPDIACSLNNLGLAWDNLGDYRKAINYHEQALQMHRSIYGQTKAHPDIARSLNNLGLAWDNLGDYMKAISYYEQALQMRRSIYGQTKAHPDIARSLNNLGLAWCHLGDYRKAISYYEQTLQMLRSIYGQGTEHPEIATSLNNLGMAWRHLGDHRKAISYHEQALQMRRSIYGQTKAHPDIATSLNNLGSAWQSNKQTNKQTDINMANSVKKLQHFQLYLKSQDDKEVVFVHALRETIVCRNYVMQVEVLKSLGDLHLEKAKLSKDSAEFDKAAALYAAALECCTVPNMKQTLEDELEHSKLCRQLLQGYSPQYQWSQNYRGTTDSNVLRVAEICDKLDRSVRNSFEQTYTEMLVTAIGNSDMFLEVEVLKSLGDIYLEKGKTTSDVSQFSKAAAMYNKAQKTCGDPETKLTLKHRIEYMEKIRKAMKRKRSSNKPRPRERSSHMENITRTHTQDQNLQTDKARAYTNHLKEGDSSLGRSDLDSAEQHFAAALKIVHVRDPTAQQYQREVEPLCKLGDVYSKRGQQTGDGGDFVKAAALYNAAIARSEDQVLNGNIETAIGEVDKLFLKCILGIHSNVSHYDTEKHKKQLKEMRDQIKLEMETIDQQLDPYVHDEDDPCVREIEAKRAQAVKQLFEKIAQQRKEFISLLVEECIGLMGPPPCKYALIGLGSQATGLVTPYSDLEFAILVEEESEECLVYFRNLSHYLHLKVVNLGETILPALGIKSLNDFYSENPLDNWYYDSVTPHGFAFDGSMPKASKTPLGRQGTKNKPPSELICTPQNMVSKLQKDVTLYLKEGYHLATILRNPWLIAGDQDLIDTYMNITVEILQADGGKMAQQLAQEIRKENMERISNEETITARLIDVKKEIYRFPALAVDCLALSSGIIPTTVWETIEEMENQQVISPNNAHHLTVLTSISAELRLRTYMANGGQKENLSALASMETTQHGQESSLQTNDEAQTNMLKPVFHLQNEKQLFRYYYTSIPLKKVLSESSEKKTNHNSFSEFYDNSPKVCGRMYKEVCKYRLAMSYYIEALKKAEDTDTSTEKIDLLLSLGFICHRTGDYQKSIDYNKEALQIHRSIYGQTTAHPQIATLFNNLGLACLGAAWHDLGDYRKAINYYEQALQMKRSIYGLGTEHPDIAGSLNNLGGAWHHLGDYSKAINYYEQALQMKRSIYGLGTEHPEIALSLNNMGGAWCHLGDYRKAISYYEQALQMNRSIYGLGTEHPDIVTSLNNLGTAWSDLGDYRNAISYHEQALQMYKSIYGQGTEHPKIATSLNNLGLAWCHLADYRKAISYQEQALQIYRSIFGQDTEHPVIAISLNSLGLAWCHLGDYRRAISYHEQALQMNRSIYGQGTEHPEIALSLNNMGGAWCNLGDYSKAISYYEQALQIRKSIYGQGTAHPIIPTLLSNLGTAWHHLGEHRKAINYHEQALQMYRSIYGQGKAHPHIATSLSNLGTAWCYLGDHRKGISYYEQALQMNRSIYGQTKAHPDIAISLNNLGSAWYHLSDYRKAISYYEQTLQMLGAIYGQGKMHPYIATSLNNLGGAWEHLGDYRKAISYYEQALQMHRSIYGQNKAHPEIATSLNNLGLAWHHLGDYRKVISYYEQALQMYRSTYGEHKPHPNIANFLNNLGTAWCHLGDCRKAISYHEQALQMSRSIYGQGTEHPDIAASLNNLGTAWYHLGDYRKAISYYEQALQMERSIYGQGTKHPNIATSLNNLGSAWYKLGDHRKAISLCKEALVMARQVYPQDKSHPLIKRIESNLASTQASAMSSIETTGNR
ncbi:PREDICTED: LOW QUALITY PROTEIN: uncharacterized protein LOC109477527 [Branchiostoma belcheri]|uniref:LOW QUALITY PROTEIN: uncharacterized protein LOC109477527 n=1 Tax=Branchiostoma belcheri TaxID=7741 RepID=A0A6P4ZTU9_BRABE|nr:PREDICTED: LOW QUALITY PROTEIN: uncharacterized protein LOC109477527 [Branchiostoma belcheri]